MRGDRAAAAGIFNVEAHHAGREVHADDELRAGWHSAVAHAVGDKFGHEQLSVVEHGRYHPVAEAVGDDAARGAGRPHVEREPRLDPFAAVDVTIGAHTGATLTVHASR